MVLLLGCDPSSNRSALVEDFYACLSRTTGVDGCLRTLVAKLQAGLPDNLPLTHPTVKDLAAAMLLLFGFKRRFVPLPELKSLPVIGGAETRTAA